MVMGEKGYYRVTIKHSPFCSDVMSLSLLTLRMTSPENTEGQNYQMNLGLYSLKSGNLFTNLQYLLHTSFSPFIILIEK